MAPGAIIKCAINGTITGSDVPGGLEASVQLQQFDLLPGQKTWRFAACV